MAKAVARLSTSHRRSANRERHLDAHYDGYLATLARINTFIQVFEEPHTIPDFIALCVRRDKLAAKIDRIEEVA